MRRFATHRPLLPLQAALVQAHRTRQRRNNHLLGEQRNLPSLQLPVRCPSPLVLKRKAVPRVVDRQLLVDHFLGNSRKFPRLPLRSPS